MELARQITESELRRPYSRWTGNDASGRWHTGRLNFSGTRDFVLHWRETAQAPPWFVGCFRLCLSGLVDAGHCKLEGNKVRVTLYHDSDGMIRVRVRRADSGGVALGRAKADEEVNPV